MVHRSSRSTPRSSEGSTSGSRAGQAVQPEITAYEVLDYIRLAFTDEKFLDTLPVDAAANPGAYHAWHAHRTQSNSQPDSRRSSGVHSSSSPRRSSELATTKARRPGEWNWEGVWEERVKKGIRSSLSEPMLFGGAGAGDDIVCHPSNPQTYVKIGALNIK